MIIWRRWLMVIAVALAAAGGGYFYGVHRAGGAHGEVEAKADDAAASTQPAEKDAPVVPVVTAPLTVAPLTETVTAYGTVVAEAGDVRVISVPFDARVTRVLVTPGQQATQGMPILQVEASPDALVALQEAKNAVDATTRDLKMAEQRFAEHLATNIELAQAQQAAQSATLKLESLAQRGVGEKHELKAEAAGIISKVDVQEGQILPAGSPLVELAAGNRIEVRLNVEPSDAQTLKPDADVQLQPVNASDADKPIAGKIRIISQRVDPATRLVEVRVTLPPDLHLMLDSFVTGRLARTSADGFIVPRDAALPDEDGGYTLFTVKDHHAVKHAVRIGLQQDQLVQVIGDDLKAGDEVIVSGNYALENGTPVQATPAATTAASPATEPAAAQPETKQ